MCGIVGYIGKNDAVMAILAGLRSLEYRGYDSAGLVYLNEKDEPVQLKNKGEVRELAKKITTKDVGNIGIGHTRWATHGAPNETNAHPHTDCNGEFFVVHNGIIENYSKLQKELLEKGHSFISETDTEVLAHLIEEYYEGDLKAAVIKALKRVQGAYALVVVSKHHKDKIIVARQSSPLLIGVGKDEMIIASDIPAVIRYTKEVVYLEDGEVAEICKDGYSVTSFTNEYIEKSIQEVEWDREEAELGGFPFFMLKEIHEQPESLTNSMRGRLLQKDKKVHFGGLKEIKEELGSINRIIITACGTAYFAGLLGEYAIEELTDLPVKTMIASDFRYRRLIGDQNTLVIAISQSGETADTLAAINKAKTRGCLTLGIVNVVGSAIARTVDAGIYNHVGPEIAVASTKAFTSQVVIMNMLAVYLGQIKGMPFSEAEEMIRDLEKLPSKVEEVLKQSDYISEVSEKYKDSKGFMYLGRYFSYPTAMEGALKLKEISYIHAEGMAAGELKHGSIALIEPSFPSLFIIPKDSVYDKTLSNLSEVRTRGGRAIAITDSDDDLRDKCDHVIKIPRVNKFLSPVLSTIVTQLLAYHIADQKDLNVDKPRNLAKSVTVE